LKSTFVFYTFILSNIIYSIYIINYNNNNNNNNNNKRVQDALFNRIKKSNMKKIIKKNATAQQALAISTVHNLNSTVSMFNNSPLVYGKVKSNSNSVFILFDKIICFIIFLCLFKFAFKFFF
jgi:hypothetical protein